MTVVRWMVLRDRFPLGHPTDLGIVSAHDKAAAITAGETEFGGRVLVRSLLSLEAERYEQRPAKVTPPALNDVEGEPLSRAERFRQALAAAGITAGAWSLEAGYNNSDVSKAARGTRTSRKIDRMIDAFIAEVEQGTYVRPAHLATKPKKRKSQFYGGGRGQRSIDASRAHELKTRFGGALLLLIALAVSSCASTAPTRSLPSYPRPVPKLPPQLTQLTAVR